MSMGFVCAMGISTVFIGLVCIILLCKIFSAIVRLGEKQGAKEVKTETAPKAAPVSAEIPDKQRIVAAVCAAVAEELGTDVSALRVLSFKKL